MRPNHTALAAVLALPLVLSLCAFQDAPPEPQWFKGNLHAHTNRCDHADSSPEDVARWYHDHGYHFVCLSEHQTFIDPAKLELGEGVREDFLVVPGVEMHCPDDIHIHMSSLGGRKVFRDKVGEEGDMRAWLTNFVQGIRSGGGIPILNHPNWLFRVKAKHLPALEGVHLFEVYSGQWQQQYYGHQPDKMTTDELWDAWLGLGTAVYGIAADDAHRFANPGDFSQPGRGWVMVQAEELSLEAIGDALLGGNFYSSSGVVLSGVSTGPDSYSVAVDEAATLAEVEKGLLQPRVTKKGKVGLRIELLGPGGEALVKVGRPSASLALSEVPVYVRGKVTYTWKVEEGFAQCHAWTQPVFRDGRELPR